MLTIGNRSTLGFNNHITSVNKVIIEEDVLTANNVYISDNIHEYSDVTMPIIKQPIRFQGSVRIGKGSWLGENVCVIGASVGRNSVVGANAVVTMIFKLLSCSRCSAKLYASTTFIKSVGLRNEVTV